MTATWHFEDAQSGIDHYEIAAQELFAGSWNLIYPQTYVQLQHVIVISTNVRAVAAYCYYL